MTKHDENPDASVEGKLRNIAELVKKIDERFAAERLSESQAQFRKELIRLLEDVERFLRDNLEDVSEK